MTSRLIKDCDPSTFTKPVDMTAAITTKERAALAVQVIDNEIARLRKLRKAWRKRYDFCIRMITHFATETKGSC